MDKEEEKGHKEEEKADNLQDVPVHLRVIYIYIQTHALLPRHT